MSFLGARRAPSGFDPFGQLTAGRVVVDASLPTRQPVEASLHVGVKAFALVVPVLQQTQSLADPAAYRRDRRKDQLLQENDYFVLRFLAEDVGKDLDLVLDAVLRGFSRRTPSSSIAKPLTVPRRPPS